MNEKLLALRQRVDRVDGRLVALFCERMDIAAEVARVKAEGGIAMTDPSREQVVIDRAVDASPADIARHTADFMHTLIRLSKAHQQTILGADSMKNIVFIGMPGCGKSTVARTVADRLNRCWYDTDDDIERTERASVAEIFARHGEGWFRRLEDDRIAQLMDRQNLVVSVGGGAILRNEQQLSQGVVVYLRRNLDAIYAGMVDSSRPLIKSAGDLAKLFDRRSAIYSRAADVTVDNDGTVDRTADMVIAALGGRISD